MALAYTEIAKNKRRTSFLLLFFVMFVAGMGFVIAEVQSPGAGYAGLAIAAGVSVVWALISYYAGDKIALAANHAKPIEKRDNPELYRLVENLSIAAGLPTPKIHIIKSQAMNAFATGRDPNHATVAVTQGLLDRLEKKEVEAVLAHELSHIGNYDIRLMMIVAALFGVVMMMHRIWWYSGHGRSSNRNGKAQMIIMILGLLFLLLGPLFATMIKFAISRKREFLADASASLLTRYPDALATALEKISSDPRELKDATKGTAHLYIANPFKAGTWSNLFSTHPPVEERIKALKGMDM